MTNFNLQDYMSNGVQRIIKEAALATLTNPKESAFIATFALNAKKSADFRKNYIVKNGIHIPPFLITSITSKCNLHCAGCYARGNNSCHDGCETSQLTDKEWGNIFSQAEDLGINFILLAGGEPLVRNDVIKKASEYKKIAFPIFTNGTMINDKYAEIFDNHRNLIPVLSIEGNKEKTDNRRGEGIYDKLNETMEILSQRKILFGASITVTKDNIKEVTSDEFINGLSKKGCKIIFYVEYVPVSENTKNLAPTDIERDFMIERIAKLRLDNDKMLFISFPGDEKTSGGCLAAGRGFFHINSHGGAEPCPFSPFSDTNVKDIPLVEALKSPLFTKLRTGSYLTESHSGGCVLFEKEEKVRELIG